MSHDGSWRAACDIKISIPPLRFDPHEEARSVTDPGVGSGALLGLLAWRLNSGLSKLCSRVGEGSPSSFGDSCQLADRQSKTSVAAAFFSGLFEPSPASKILASDFTSLALKLLATTECPHSGAVLLEMKRVRQPPMLSLPVCVEI
jgi:hypothetical protein